MSSLTRGISVGTVAIDTVAESLWPRLAGLLDHAERQRAAHFVVERDRRLQIAAHALKRLMLTACAPGFVPPKSWRFEMGAGGQPTLCDRTSPRFNLSHCDGLVACGVSRRFRVGVDVKPLSDEVSFDFVRSQFSDDEVSWLSQQPADAHAEAFFRFWNLKEAYRNAVDPGAAPMPDFVKDFDPLRRRFVDSRVADAASWRFLQVEMGPRHTLALAWQAGPRKIPVDVRAVHFEEMLYGVDHKGRSSPWRFGSGPGPLAADARNEFG